MLGGSYLIHNDLFVSYNLFDKLKVDSTTEDQDLKGDDQEEDQFVVKDIFLHRS